MTQDEQAQLYFTPNQLEILSRTCDVITGPFTDKLVHNTIRKLYWDSIFAAYNAGRFSGVSETRSLVDRAIDSIKEERLNVEHPK